MTHTLSWRVVLLILLAAVVYLLPYYWPRYTYQQLRIEAYVMRVDRWTGAVQRGRFVGATWEPAAQVIRAEDVQGPAD